ncbi:MAG: DUF2029 domain-containing protein [Betaproteobacteria bacterium]|nr:DUF2029 domain-containing protein [Betaproteobacteria bacterium]
MTKQILAFSPASRALISRLATLDWLDSTILRTLIILCMCWAVTLAMGKDVNADLLNYHIYAAHSVASGQFRIDFMGAGPQSYLNPVGYLFFFYMMKAGVSAVIMALVLASVHALNLMLLWHISHQHFFRDLQHRNALAAVSVLLGGLSPVFIATIGGSFLDPVLSVLVLGALALVLGTQTGQPFGGRHFFSAGLLLGLATGLKLTSAVFCVAVFACLWLIRHKPILRVQAQAYLVAGGICGFILTGGWWSWMLWQQFGNPVFPLFNNIFQSADFSTGAISHDRFLPHGISDYLFLPARMMRMNSGIYVEILAPDLRMFLLQVALIVMGVLAVASRALKSVARSVRLPDQGMLAISFFLIAWILNQALSGNGRYALSLLLLAGPLLVLSIHWIAGKGHWVLPFATIIATLQFLHGLHGGYPRWDAAPWTRNWIDVDAPAKLKSTPFGYLSLSTFNQSMAMPYLAKGSGLVELMGFEPRDPQGPGSSKVQAFIRHYDGRLRMLIHPNEGGSPDADGRGQISPKLAVTSNRLLRPWGFQISQDDCEYLKISVHGGESTPASATADRYELGYLAVSCGLILGAVPDPLQDQERSRFSPVFDAVVRACPSLFPPPGGYPHKYGDAWVKRFAESDTILSILNEKVQFSRYPFGPFSVDLGIPDDWKKSTQKFECRRYPRPW